MTEQQTDYQALYEEALNGWHREASEEARRFVQDRDLVVEREWPPREFPPNDGTSPALPAAMEDGSWTVGRLHFRIAGGRLSVTTDDGEELWTA